MKEIQLTITALSPLAIGRQKPGGSISEAQNYIPGTVIRGAIASQILNQSSSNTDQPGGDFQALFLDEAAATFSNAYPTNTDKRSLVLPATAVSSKTEPGFKTEGNKGGVFDTLIDRFCAESYRHLYDPSCPKDGGRVEPFSGFYTVEGKKYQTHSVSTRLLTRVGINRRRSTAQENVLYSIEAINETQRQGNEPTVFGSTIQLEDSGLASTLVQYINSNRWRLGGSTSRGLGSVAIKATLGDVPAVTAARVKTFNVELRKRWKTWSIFGDPQQPLPDQQEFFTVNLQSDAILTEQWRRTTIISPAMLLQMSGIKDSTLKLHASYSSYDYRSGWNTAWGLMKDIELVTSKGAVYLFSTTQLGQWLPVLERFSQYGVGERTTEGFGQIQICSEFHQVFREAAV